MGRYTPQADPRVDDAIERQLRRAVEAIRETHPATEAVFLLGGFGRAEGSAIVKEGNARALNDYDLLVISGDETGRRPLRELSKTLADAFGIDYVDIGLWSPAVLDRLPPTIFNYDLRHGAQVLFGHAELLDRIPRFTSKQLPPWEGVQLLLNRMAGLLSGFALRGEPSSLEPVGLQYFRNQVVKALLACGDALIVQEGAYRHRYAERREVLRLWDRDGKLPPWLGRKAVARIDQAYGEKLAPGSAPWPDDVGLMVEFLPTLERVFLRCLSRYLSREVSSLASAADAYLDTHRLGRLARALAVLRPVAGVPQRHVVYASLPLILFSLPLLHSDNLARLARKAHIVLRGAEERGRMNDGGWDALRRVGVQLWERHCHG
jgi:hypothetical protein